MKLMLAIDINVDEMRALFSCAFKRKVYKRFISSIYLRGYKMIVYKYCDSTDIVKNGKVKGKQIFECRVCGHRFTEGSAFPKMRTKSRIISTSIDLYFEGLSVRKVQTQIERERERKNN